MWRPDGWKCQYLGKKANRYFELGADAILEALRKDVSAGRTDGTTKEYTVINFCEVAGTFVFIPEEEE